KHYEMTWLENTKQWIERTGCNSIAIWEWNCPAAADPVWKDIPWVQGDLVTRNLRCFEELGAEYIYFDQGPVDNYNDTQLSYPLRWPLWYVSAKSMWDRHETASQILMSACYKLFEDAGDLMFAYYSCLADINSKCYSKAIAWHMPEPEEMYTDDAVKRIDGILSAVSASSSGISEKAAKRVADQTELWSKARKIIMNRTGE
ncbi:MAG: hypothetical protein ACYC5K_07100, partial [Saccharofermentanales bacterium]